MLTAKRQSSEVRARDEDEAVQKPCSVASRTRTANRNQTSTRSAVCGPNEWLPRACVVGVATYYTGWPENLQKPILGSIYGCVNLLFVFPKFKVI